MARYELIIESKATKRVASKVGGAGGIFEQWAEKEARLGSETTERGVSASAALQNLFGYHAVKSVASQVVGHRVSTVQLRTGSHEAQERANFTYSIAQQGLGLVEGFIGGMAVGGPIGATIGVMSSLIHTAISWNQKADTLRLQRNLEENQQFMAAQRATYSGSRYQTVLDE